jgi:hypothetical protein
MDELLVENAINKNTEIQIVFYGTTFEVVEGKGR